MLKVIKRDGRVKDFDFNRIVNAIQKAYEDVYSTVSDRECRWVELDSIVMELDDIFNKLYKSNKVESIEVEKLQDMIVEVIEKTNKDVAKSYSQYRKNRTIVRESKTNLLKSISKIIDSTNHDVLKENSNKQGQLESTKRDLIAGEVSKEIARQIIPKHLMDAHDAGIIKIHDLDYFMQNLYNCELVNLEDMLQNGTVINKKMIDKPKSLRTAMTLATQIAAQVSSFTYGGQTMSLSHLAPFVRISKEKIENKYRKMNLGISEEQLQVLVKCELMDEIKDAVQTFNYQISTIMTTNGQSPFISVCMYISENPEYEEETVMLIEEFLKQE